MARTVTFTTRSGTRWILEITRNFNTPDGYAVAMEGRITRLSEAPIPGLPDTPPLAEAECLFHSTPRVGTRWPFRLANGDPITTGQVLEVTEAP
jgi:hypothetical protein